MTAFETDCPPLRAPLRTAAAALALALATAGGAAAQSNPVTPPAPGMAGACGQPLALTHVLGLPLDQAAPGGPVALALARLEPAYVEFALAAPARVTLRGASPTSHDTYLTLFDAAGRVVASDDDGAGSLQPLLQDQALAPGRYCAQMRVYGGTDTIAAQATLELRAVASGGGGMVAGLDPSRPCGDPALTLDAGRLIAPGFGGLSLTGTVPEGARRDWRMTVAMPVTLQLEAMSPVFDTVLELYDGFGGLIAENDDRPQGGTDSEVIQALAPGDYCVSLRGFSGGGGAVQLVLSEAAAAAAPGIPIGSGPCGDPALTLDAGQLAQGFGRRELALRIGNDSRQDVRFALAAGGQITLEALGQGGFDTVLALHDAGGTLIDENDDRPQGGTDSELVAGLAPGSYCASVRGFAGAGGQAVLALSEGGGGGFGAPGVPAAPGLPGVPGIPGFGGGGLGGGLGGGMGGGMAASGPCGDPARTVALGAAIGPGLPGLSLSGQVEPNGVSDWSLSATGAAEARMTARSTSFDTMLELYDARGTRIAENDDAPGMGTDSEIVAMVQPGDYCLRVQGYAGAGGSYDLALALPGGGGGGGGMMTAPGGGTMLAPPAPGSVTDLGTLAEVVEGSATQAGDTLWFRMAVTEAGRFELRGLSLGGPLVLQLADAGGARLQEAQAAGGFDIAQMTADLAPGAYLVALHWPQGGGRAALRQLVVTRQ